MKTYINILLLAVIFTSCNQETDIIDEVKGSWSISSAQGVQGDITTSLNWSDLIINNERTFQLFTFDENGDEEEVARGNIEICKNLIIQNCYEFTIDFKNLELDFNLETDNVKSIKLEDGSLILQAITDNQISYILN
jgi:hypothetical protein